MVTNKDDTVVDMKLFKTIGLYQLLCAAERGGISERLRRACLTLIWLNIGYFAVQFAWLPFTVHDLKNAMFTAMVISYFLTSTIKGYALLHHKTRLWNVLDSGRFAFTTCGAQRPANMRRCRDTLSVFLRLYVSILLCTSVMWMMFPLFWTEYVSVTHADGTVGRLRGTVWSMWFPMPEHIHNSLPGWSMLYSVEATSLVVGAISFILFDTYMITMCFVLNAQFHTIFHGYKTLGSRLRKLSSDNNIDVFQDNSRESMKPDHYSNLVCHIQDNQKLINVYDKFVGVLQPFVITNILIGSFSVITYIFFVCLAIVSNQSIMNMELFKVLCTSFALIIQLYIYCHGFHIIETAKSSLNFGLYSCNWTEMDLRFKKTMLLAMAMNSAHKKTMKVTPIHVINLELFFRVVKTSFSTIPVLLQLSS